MQSKERFSSMSTTTCSIPPSAGMRASAAPSLLRLGIFEADIAGIADAEEDQQGGVELRHGVPGDDADDEDDAEEQGPSEALHAVQRRAVEIGRHVLEPAFGDEGADRVLIGGEEQVPVADFESEALRALGRGLRGELPLALPDLLPHPLDI